MSSGEVLTPVRGCGTRVKGGIYLVCGFSPDGRPVEHFLVDPPIVLEKPQLAELGLSPIGVHMVATNKGGPHVFDWVGSKHYPNVADFVEEVKRYGMSRRAPTNLDFQALRPGSRQVLLHSRAEIKQPWAGEYQRARMRLDGPDKWCPRHIKEHTKNLPLLHGPGDYGYESMCAALWWEDIEGETKRGPFASGWPRSVSRIMPSFTYDAWGRPLQVFAPVQHEVGIFMALPITGIHVIRDDKQGKHEKAVQKLHGVHLPWEVKDE